MSWVAKSLTTPTSVIRAGKGPVLTVEIEKTGPSCSLFKRFFISLSAGLHLSTWPTAAISPDPSKASTISAASSVVPARGFSINT